MNINLPEVSVSDQLIIRARELARTRVTDRAAILQWLDEIASIRRRELDNRQHREARVADFARQLGDEVLANRPISRQQLLHLHRLVEAVDVQP